MNVPEASASSCVRLSLRSCKTTRSRSGSRDAETAVEQMSPLARPSCSAETAVTGAHSKRNFEAVPYERLRGVGYVPLVSAYHAYRRGALEYESVLAGSSEKTL